jgi:hypothetical protein
MRPPSLPGERRGPEGRRQIREVPRVQSGDLLLQRPLRAAHGRARESVQGADSDLRLLGLRGASVRESCVPAVQCGDVLQQRT